MNNYAQNWVRLGSLVFAPLRHKDIGTVWLVGCLVATGRNGEQFCS